MIQQTRNIYLGFVILFVAALSGCGGSASQSGSPEEFARYFYTRLSVGDVDAAVAVMDPEQTQLMSAEEIKVPMKEKSALLKSHGGIKEFKLQISGAESNPIVKGSILMNDGQSVSVYDALRKVNGKWYVG